MGEHYGKATAAPRRTLGKSARVALDQRDIVRHCTLAPEHLAALATKRADHNRLGYALLLCAMRI